MNGWTKGTLGGLCGIEIGGTPSRSNPEYWDSAKDTSNRWVSIKDLNRRTVCETSEHITDLGVRNSNVKLQPQGTILLSFKLSIGRVAFAGCDLYTNEAIAGLRSEELTPDFLFHGLQQWNLLENVDQAIKGATLNKDKLKKIEFEYPVSQTEQAKIAEVLSTLDRAIEQTEALIAKQQRIKTGLMQDLLTKGIDEHGNIRSEATHAFKDSPLGRIPVEWAVVKLGEVSAISSGITLGKTYSGPKTIELPYLCVANVQDGFLDLTEVKAIRVPIAQIEKYRLQVGDVLMNEGGDFDKLGRGTVWHGEIELCLHQNHVFKARPLEGKLSSDFLAYVSSSPYGKAFFVLASKQSTNLASINSTQLKSFLVPLPPYHEQVRIQESIFQNERAIGVYQDELKKWRQLKAGLMHDLLTGNRRVTPLLAQATTQ